jgi:hypothetical protein
MTDLYHIPEWNDDDDDDLGTYRYVLPTRRLAPADAVAELGSLVGVCEDREDLHEKADAVLMATLPVKVADAYQRLRVSEGFGYS